MENLEIMSYTKNFWHNKRVLVTGHTGFKGGWLTLWLKKMGAEITGIGLAPSTSPSLFELSNISAFCDSHFCDIRDLEKLSAIIDQVDPEIVFHLAAQPLVRASFKGPLLTFSTNIMGTANVLECLRGAKSTRVAVMITTDKVYHNNEWVWPYKETDALGGHDPYSSSKAASEIVINSYRQSFLSAQGIALASARAGNVIGGGDWSEDRLIPDAIRSWQSKTDLQVRRPEAKRPWQHVLEPLSGYLLLAEKLWGTPELAGAYNFGPQSHDAATVRQVIDSALKIHETGTIFYSETNDGLHEAGCLALEISKAREILGFNPRLSLNDAIKKTMNWYKLLAEGTSALELCERDIASYESQK
jgi:CDP-glucose 4,6-dehydratase